jgi:tetratricopeptide (TPR) repeat protein
MRVAILLLGLALLTPTGRSLAAGEKPVESDTDSKLIHAEELFEQGHTAEARQICEGVLRGANAPAQLAHALNVMSKIHAAGGDYDRAVDSAKRSAEAYEQLHDSSGAAHALNNKGIAELQSGGYESAQKDLQEAFRLSQTGNDVENQVQVLNNLGSAHYFRGSYGEATRSYEEAMSLVRSNAAAKWSDYWLEITRFNQATLLQRLGHYQGALQIYREVQASSKTLTGGDRAHVEANLGTLYRRLGDPYKAMDAYGAAQKLYSTQHDADGEIAVLKNIGIAYALDLDDLGHAAGIFRAALALAEKTHNRREQMQAHLYLGETLLRGRELRGARDEFQRAAAIANELSTSEEQWKSLYGLGRPSSSWSVRASRGIRPIIAIGVGGMSLERRSGRGSATAVMPC